MHVTDAHDRRARRVDHEAAQVGHAAAHIEAATDAVERYAFVAAAQQALRLGRPASQSVAWPGALGHGKIDGTARDIERTFRRAAPATQAQVDIGHAVLDAGIEAQQAGEILERDVARGGGKGCLPVASGGIVDEIEARRARADRGSGPESVSRRTRHQGHRAVGDLAREARHLADPRRHLQVRAAEPVGLEGRRRQEALGGRGRGICRRCRRRLEAGRVDLRGIDVHRDIGHALAVGAEQRLAGQLAVAHFQRWHFDLEVAAQGGGLGAQRIRAAARDRYVDVGAKHRDVGALARDLDAGPFDADSALDRDFAATEAALQVDVAGQAAHPAVERSGGAGEVEGSRSRRREVTLHLQRLPGRRRLQGATADLEDDRRVATALGDGQYRVAHLDVGDPGKSGVGDDP